MREVFDLFLARADTEDPAAFILLWMGFMSLIYLFCALRTNLVLCIIFLGLMLTFLFLAAAFWQEANGIKTLGERLIVGGAACGFVACAAGWYLFAGILLATMDFPFSLPGRWSPVQHASPHNANSTLSGRPVAHHQRQKQLQRVSRRH